MKTLNEFSLLSQAEQDEIVTDHGLFLVNYVQGDLMFDVYKVFNFYVKISYDLNEDGSASIVPIENLNLFNFQSPK